MSIRAFLYRRLRALVRRRAVESELAEELDFHIQMQARKHREAGFSDDEALHRARLEFGNVELVKEDARDVRGTGPIEDFAADVRYAWRCLRRAPIFALSVILTIGLGVGLNTSVFTIFDAYVLRPFDVPDPYSLYSVQWLDRAGHVRDFILRDVASFQAPLAEVADVAAYTTFSARLNTLPATGDAVSANYFQTAGVKPALGRTLIGADEYSPVLVLSHAVWQRWFGSDSSIVGKALPIRGTPFRVVGVAQQGFDGFFKKPRDFWMPIAAPRVDSSRSALEGPVSLLVRLAPQASPARARAIFAAALRTATRTEPDSSQPLRVFLNSRATRIDLSVGALFAFAPLTLAFALILALACANVANMLLARGIARQRELGTRLALGASRSRIVRQLVTECVVLALPAVAVGFAIAWLVVRIGVATLFATLPPDLAGFVRLVPLHPDIRVFGFAIIASTASAFLVGLTPALETTRLAVVDAIRGNFAGKSPSRFRALLVTGQITVATLLLAIAAVLLREAARLGRMETGLRTHDVISVEVQDRFRSPVFAALQQKQPIEAIGSAAALPLDMRFPTTMAMASDSTAVRVLYNRVSASYFDVLGIPLVGRAFTSAEEHDGGGAVIVSETAARRLWPGVNPLGRAVRLQPQAAQDPAARFKDARVVGIAHDVAVSSIDAGRNRAVFYFPQHPSMSGCCFLVRVRGDPIVTKDTIAADLDRLLPGSIDRVDVLDTFVAAAVYPYRAAYWVALALGLLALALTVIGVYGVVAYVVTQRVREVGVRIALGATAGDVLGLMLRQTVRHTAVGALIGGVIGFGVVRVMASEIQSVPAFDAVAFAGAIGVVFVACLAAAFLPAGRAVRTDPTIALRQD